MKRARHEIEAGGDRSATPSLTGAGHVTLAADRETQSPLKQAKVSRRIQACTECQARKIKCDLSPGEVQCSRCVQKGIRCIVNKSLQSLLEDESEWKRSVEQTSQQLQLAVSKILQTIGLPALHTFIPEGIPKTPNHKDSSERPSDPHVRFRNPDDDRLEHGAEESMRSAGMAMTRENSQELSDSNDIGRDLSAPMGTLFEVTKLRNLRSNPRARPPDVNSLENDFISQKKILESEARELFDIFSRSLNHYLWGGIALLHTDVDSVRRSSSLLLAAILTVTALHVSGRTQTFEICYTEFMNLVCDSMLDRYHSMDAIRGLCIGAFWLSDLSWKLSGHAVRIATEMNLHQSYSAAMKGSREHLEGARLWYLLYVCDHHFSIAYGRPPVIHADASILDHEKFLQLPGITQADFRLHSQVDIFIVLTEIYHTFGPGIDQKLSEADLGLLRQFNISLDTWRIRWESQLAPNDFIASYPAQGVSLHYYFATLQLNSLSLRGFQQDSSFELTHSRRELAMTAVSCALSILQLVVEEQDIRNALVGVPLYLHTMITYAAVFLLKVHLKWKAAHLGTETGLIQNLVSQVIDLLNSVTASERHLSFHIAAGLTKLLGRFTAWAKHEELTTSRSNVGGVSQTETTENVYPVAHSSGYGLNPGFAPLELYEEAMPLYDENYFPVGFFDFTGIEGMGHFAYV